MPEPKIVTTAENRDLKAGAAASLRAAWPEFVLHDAVSNAYRAAAGEYFPQFDVLLVDNGEVLANAVHHVRHGPA